jgi:hypothetical protein
VVGFERTHFALFSGEVRCNAFWRYDLRCRYGAGRRKTHRIDKLPTRVTSRVGVRRGQPVGALAASSDGGGIADDPTAACPVLLSMRQGPISHRVVPLCCSGRARRDLPL